MERSLSVYAGDATSTASQSSDDVTVDIYRNEERCKDLTVMSLRDRNRSRKLPYLDHVRKQRKAIQNMTKPLKLWLYRNKAHPYPTKSDKVELASASKMTLTQVSNWFANARRRLKNTVQYPGLAWDQRIRMYNSHASGNAELLSVASGEREEQQDERWAFEAAANAISAAAAQAAILEEPKCLLRGNPHKFKNTILQRYLNDSIKYANSTSHYPEMCLDSYQDQYSAADHLPPSYRYIKHRQISGSSGGDDTTSDGCLSPAPLSSNCQYRPWTNGSNKLQNNFNEDHCLWTQLSASCNLNTNELGAVIALTQLALGTC